MKMYALFCLEDWDVEIKCSVQFDGMQIVDIC